MLNAECYFTKKSTTACFITSRPTSAMALVSGMSLYSWIELNTGVPNSWSRRQADGKITWIATIVPQFDVSGVVEPGVVQVDPFTFRHVSVPVSASQVSLVVAPYPLAVVAVRLPDAS